MDRLNALFDRLKALVALPATSGFEQGIARRIAEEITLDKKFKHTIEVVVDRLVAKTDIRRRVADSVETALRLGSGSLVVHQLGVGDIRFSHVTQFTFEPPPLVTIRASQVEVCWNSISNLTYQVQYRSTLTTNTWTNLGSPVIGSGSTYCITDKVPLGEPRRFYRVLTSP